MRELCQANEVTLKVYTEEIRDITRYEPKLKYVEALVDTDEENALTLAGTDTSDDDGE